MDQLKLTRALMAMTPEVRKQAVAALEAAADPNNRLTQVVKSWGPHAGARIQAALRAGGAQGTPEYRTALTAQQILEAGARARGEDFDPSTMMAAPKQEYHKATADEMIEADRKRRGL